MKTQTQTLNAFIIPQKVIQVVKISKIIGIITGIIFIGTQLQGLFVDRALIIQESDYALSSSDFDTQNNKTISLRNTLAEEEKLLQSKAIDRCNKFRALKAYKISKGIPLQGKEDPCLSIQTTTESFQ